MNHDPYPRSSEALVVEAWAQGYMVGSLIIMSFITLANMRRGAMLHKLILLELLLGMWQGFWLFPTGRAGRWWLSVAAIPLNLSWWLHNLIAWMKVRAFLPDMWSKVFLATVALTLPYWGVEIYANFSYFNGDSELFRTTRPLELLFRDPWWIITTLYLLIVIKTQYELTLKEVVHISPRFAVMLFAMLLSITFVVLDVLSVTEALRVAGTTGINPFWKLSFVFKCLTDSVILDDFKTALDRLRAFKMRRLGSSSSEHGNPHASNGGNMFSSWEAAESEARKASIRPSRATPKPSPMRGFDDASNFPGFQGTFPREKEPHDSLEAPERRSTFTSFDLEEVVSSAIEDLPLVPLKDAHLSGQQQHNWATKSHYESEADYASALRDMSAQPSPRSPVAPSPPPRQL